MSTIGRKAVTRRGMLRTSAFGSYPDSPLSAQFPPLTESARERVSCLAHAGEAGPDRVRAARQREGPHSTACVL